MSYKKRIFIGSSSENLKLANDIKIMLDKLDFDCKVWNSDFFEYGHSYFEDLIKKVIVYDYAILIGGFDDEVIRTSTKEHKYAPRDNIYLEYGLFSGIISPYRTLLLKDKRCVVASDLSGISIAEYSDTDQALSLTSTWINHRVHTPPNSIGRENIELLPTVGIAVGYFENFLLLLKNKFSNVTEYGDIKLTIYIPDYITYEFKDYRNQTILQHSLTDATLNDLRLLYKQSQNQLDIYDVPSTITAIFKTVDFMWGVFGENEDARCAKLRALDNFTNNLRIMINTSSWLKERVTILRLSEKN